MGLLDRFRREDTSTESPCPRCGIPVPRENPECTACGWDTREAYHAAPGSRVALTGEQ
jgi:predicted RNA-binding Zn-ribbon protein involved in translation (DUF1610 family)